MPYTILVIFFTLSILCPRETAKFIFSIYLKMTGKENSREENVPAPADQPLPATPVVSTAEKNGDGSKDDVDTLRLVD